MSDSEDEVAEKQLKLVLVGDSGTGKTSIVKRYCHHEFSRQYFPTAGVDFFLKRTIVHGTREVTLQLWDVGGAALAGNMLDKYVFGAHMVVFVFDLTNSTSFESVRDWLNAVKSVTVTQGKPPVIALLGNKSDMEHQRTVRADRQQKFALEHNLNSYVVSARTGENVSLIFQKMAAELLGLKLTKAEQEEHQPVVRAEIADTNIYTPEATATRRNQFNGNKSSVCNIQ